MNKLWLHLLSFSTLLGVASSFTPPASAQCVQAHLGIQGNISQSPAEQTHNVRMRSQPSCTGNTSVTEGQQINVGGNGSTRQHQSSEHEVRGSQGNETGVNGPTFQGTVVAPINVTPPARFPR